MSEERFATEFKEDAKGTPGLVLHDDGTVWVVQPGGTEVEVGAGNGGSQTSIVFSCSASTPSAPFNAELPNQTVYANVPVPTTNVVVTLIIPYFQITAPGSFSMAAGFQGPITLGDQTIDFCELIVGFLGTPGGSLSASYLLAEMGNTNTIPSVDGAGAITIPFDTLKHLEGTDISFNPATHVITLNSAGIYAASLTCEFVPAL